tara:strand:- start:155 stop:574 length:420 start_codon:yes stop_codon:yes gene_type:complete
MSNFNYKAGMHSVGQYQMSAIPYTSASLTVPVLGTAPLELTFPRVSRFVTVRNTLATDATSVPFRVGFSSIGTSGSVAGQNNYFTLDNGESYTGEWRVKSVYLVSDSTTQSSASIIAGMTAISTSSLGFDNWSGSLGVG